MLKWLLGLLDKGLKWSYGFYTPERMWALAKLWSGIVEKFAVGSFLVGVFQGKSLGIFIGLLCVFTCSAISLLETINNQETEK